MQAREPPARPVPVQILAVREYRGFAYGFRQPILRYSVRCELTGPLPLQELDNLLAKEITAGFPTPSFPPEDSIAVRFMHWTRVILEKAVHPCFESARFARQESTGIRQYSILQPCLHPAETAEVVRFLGGGMNRILASDNSSSAADSLREPFARLLRLLSSSGPRGFNSQHLLAAAHDLDIPWFHLGGNLYQLGMGARSRWIDSSFTDATPAIASSLAKNKAKTSGFLRAAGLPVPDQRLAADEDAAEYCAEQLGYPVVVKPADQDGGKGVRAGLSSGDAVRRAYRTAAALSTQVLIEKHVPGRDYRVQVVNGDVQGIIEREPGGITGNGIDTITTLLERQNEERRTATDERRYLHAINVDDEAEEQLAAQGMQGDSIPAPEQFVRLRAAANVASGGIPKPVPIEAAHPDNLDLAKRAARLLRLDVAGIDLLIPDIRHSWHDSGAWICEVNAQPQMFSTLHKPMLVSLMNGGQGRIPVALVIGSDPEAMTIGKELHRILLAGNIQAGLTNPHEVRIGDKLVQSDNGDILAGGRMLLLDTAVEALVLCTATPPRHGWPVDRCDVVMIAGNPGQMAVHTRNRFDNLIHAAADLSPRVVIVDRHVQSHHGNLRQWLGMRPQIETIGPDCSPEQTASRAVRHLMEKP